METHKVPKRTKREIRRLINSLKNYATNERDREKIMRAIRFAKTVHAKDLRDDKKPYILHPLKVGRYAAEYGCNADLVCAAILHDTIEDGNVRMEKISKEFGTNVARIVLNLTKPRLYRGEWIFANDERFYRIVDEYTPDRYHERGRIYYSNLINSGDVDAILIKLFDNLHNLETLHLVDKEKKIRNSIEIAQHSLLLVSRLFSGKLLNYFITKLQRANPNINVEEYLAKEMCLYEEPVIVLPPRNKIDVEMFKRLPLPTSNHICVYGTPQYALFANNVEIGLPPKWGDQLENLRKMLRGFRVKRGRSLLPKQVDAHEQIYVIEGFRPKSAVMFNAQQKRVGIKTDEIEISMKLDALDNAVLDGPIYHQVINRFNTLIRILNDFYKFVNKSKK